MIEGYSPLVQTALGTGMTWGATALGAFFCILQPTNGRMLENVSITLKLLSFPLAFPYLSWKIFGF